MLETRCGLTDRTRIDELLEVARGTTRERRAAGREPFCLPALIVDARGRELAAFTRDISAQGVGLVHGLPLAEQRVTLHLQVADRPRIVLTVHLQWCLPCGEGFYVSGGEFVSD